MPADILLYSVDDKENFHVYGVLSDRGAFSSAWPPTDDIRFAWRLEIYRMEPNEEMLQIERGNDNG